MYGSGKLYFLGRSHTKPAANILQFVKKYFKNQLRNEVTNQSLNKLPF